MAKIDRIVNVQIALNTTATNQKSFSDLLILGAHNAGVNRVEVVTDPNQLADLGIGTNTAVYRAVSDVFKQIPTLKQVFVGRMANGATVINVDTASQTDYSVTISYRNNDGEVVKETATYTGKSRDTAAQIATGLVTAITSQTAPVTAKAAEGKITVTNNNSSDLVGVTTHGNLSVEEPTSTESPTDALTAIAAENNDWYGLVTTLTNEAKLLEVSEYAEANEKLHGITSDQAGIIDSGSTTDLATKLKEKQYFRTHVWYHGKPDESLAAAITTKAFTYQPGSETWANKRLQGISYDQLREGQFLAAKAKNANTFEPFRGNGVTQSGKVAAGEWIDVIRFRDWLVEEIRVNVFSAMINADGKIPYTDGGIGIIVAAMRQALDLGVIRGGIAPEELDEDGNKIPSYIIDYPRAANISANRKASRILEDLKFTARLAGAIHVVEIKGAVTYAFN